jgi:hypothetical protein
MNLVLTGLCARLNDPPDHRRSHVLKAQIVSGISIAMIAHRRAVRLPIESSDARNAMGGSIAGQQNK